MNRLFRFFAFAVVSVCALGFISCSNDDDDDDNSSPSAVLEGQQTSPEEISGDSWVLSTAKSKVYVNYNGYNGFVPLESAPQENNNGLILTGMTFYADGTADWDVSGIKSKGEYSLNGKDFTCSHDILVEVNTPDGVVKKQVPFTAKKGVDIADIVAELAAIEQKKWYKENDFGGEGMFDAIDMTLEENKKLNDIIITSHDLTKQGNKLYIKYSLRQEINYDFNISDEDLEEMGEFGGLFENLQKVNKQPKLFDYYLVYNKK